MGVTPIYLASTGIFRKVDDDVDLPGVTLTLDSDNVGSGVNVFIIANQGSDLDGGLKYNATDNRWEISNNGGSYAAIVTDGSISLDTAYNVGHSITVDAGPIILTQSGSTDAFQISQSGSGDAINIALSSSLVNQALVVTESNAIRTAAMVQLTRQASATGYVIDINNDATATSRSINIDHAGTGKALVINNTNTGGSYSIDIAHAGTGPAVYVLNTGANSSFGTWVEGTAATACAFYGYLHADGRGLYLIDGSIAATVPMVELSRNSAVVNTSAHVVSITNAGAARPLSISNTGTNDGIYVAQTSASGTAAALKLYLSGAAYNYGIDISETSVARSSAMVKLSRIAAATGHVLDIANAATVTARAINITHAGNVPAIYISASGTGPDIHFTARSSDPSAIADGDFWYNTTDGRLKYRDDATTRSLAYTSELLAAQSMDDTYNVGHSITVDAGAVGLVLTTADNSAISVTEDGTARATPAVLVTRGASSTGACFEGVKNGGTDSVFNAVPYQGTGYRSFVNGGGIGFYAYLDTHTGDRGILIEEDAGVARTAAMISLVRQAAASGACINVAVNGGGGAAFNMTDSTSTKAFFQAAKGETSAVSGSGAGRLIYDSSANAWKISANGGAYQAILTGSTSALTMDDTYNNGHGIIVDSGPISLTANSVDATSAIEINRGPTSSAAVVGIAITLGDNASATAKGIAIQHGQITDAIRTGFAQGFSGTDLTNRTLHTQQILDPSTTRQFIWLNGTMGSSSTRVTPTATSAYAAAFGIESTDSTMSLLYAPAGTNQTIERMLTTSASGVAVIHTHADSDVALTISRLPTGSSAAEILSLINNSSCTGKGIRLVNSGTGDGIYVEQSSATGTNTALTLYVNGAASNKALYITETNVARDQPLVYVDRKALATYPAVIINNAGEHDGLNIQHSSTSGGRYGLYIYLDATDLTSGAAYIGENASGAARSIPLMQIVRGAGTGHALLIDNDGTGQGIQVYQSGSAAGLNIYLDGSSTASYGGYVWESSSIVRTNPLFLLNRAATSTGTVLDITGNGAGACILAHANGTGQGLFIYLDGALTQNAIYASEDETSVRSGTMCVLHRGALSTGVTLDIQHNGLNNAFNLTSKGTAGIAMTHEGGDGSIGALLQLGASAGNAWGLYVTEAAVVRGLPLVYFTTAGSNYARTGSVLKIETLTTTATGHSLEINHDGSGSAISITADGSAGVFVTHNGPTASIAVGVGLSSSASSTAYGIAVSDLTATVRSTPLVYFSSYIGTYARTGPILKIESGSNTGTGAAIEISNTSYGHSINITHTASFAAAAAINIELSGGSSGAAGFYIHEDTSVGRTYAMIWGSRASGNSGAVCKLDNAGTGAGLDVNHSATGANAIDVDATNIAMTVPLVDLTSTSTSATGGGLRVDYAGSTGWALEVVQGPSSFGGAVQASMDTSTVSSAHYVPDCYAHSIFKLTMSSACWIDNPTTPYLMVGATYIFVIIHGGTPATVTWGSYYLFPGGVDPTLSTSASAIDVISGVAISASQILCNFQKGYA